jgi:hypothetical protein
MVGDNEVDQLPRTLGDCTKMVEMLLDARSFVPFTRQFQQHETDATGLTLYMPARQNGPLQDCRTMESVLDSSRARTVRLPHKCTCSD